MSENTGCADEGKIVDLEALDMKMARWFPNSVGG